MSDRLFEHYQEMLNDLQRCERHALTSLPPSTPFLEVIEIGTRFAKIRAHAKHTFHLLAA